MKSIKLIVIMFAGCAVHQLHAGGPAGTVTREIADQAAANAARNVGRAAGEIAHETAEVAGKPSFAYHGPTPGHPTMTALEKAQYTQAPLPTQQKPFVPVSPKVRKGIMKAYEKGRVQTSPGASPSSAQGR